MFVVLFVRDEEKTKCGILFGILGLGTCFKKASDLIDKGFQMLEIFSNSTDAFHGKITLKLSFV